MKHQKQPLIRLLLVDDEAEFRRSTARVLTRRGFEISEAASGEEALEQIRNQPPQLVILDLKMPGMDGIETLHHIRKIDRGMPVIVLTGHGNFHDAFAGIQLEIVDFLQKPIDMDQLANRVRVMLEHGRENQPLRERTIAELMVSPRLYPKLYVDQSADVAFKTLTDLFFRPQGVSVRGHGIRSALVYDRDGAFVGMVRFNDLLRLILPDFLRDSPYSSYFTGMFVAQCKVITHKTFVDILETLVSVDVHAPLMEAIHLMVDNQLSSLPVTGDGELVGILRDRAVILEIAKNTMALR